MKISFSKVLVALSIGICLGGGFLENAFAETYQTDQWVVGDTRYYTKEDGNIIKTTPDGYNVWDKVDSAKSANDTINQVNKDATNGTLGKDSPITDGSKNDPATSPAAETDPATSVAPSGWQQAQTPMAEKPTEVIVTEAIPGADCEPFWTGTGPEGKQFKCKVTGGFSSVMGIFGSLIKYATYITALIGVLMMVVTGIAYMFGEWEFKKEMKEQATRVIIGLITLFLIAFILNTVAPWIYSA